METIPEHTSAGGRTHPSVRRGLAWSLNDYLYLRLADFHRGFPARVMFRSDDADVFRRLESATPEFYDRFLSEVSPLLRFELRLFDNPQLPSLLRHPIVARADQLVLCEPGKEPGQVGGYGANGGVSERAIAAVAECPILLSIERVVIDDIQPGARSAADKLAFRHPKVMVFPLV